ncbi:MAG: glycosyltransferase [Puniceicoccales bacterium]|jgi:glycosyltransferase involved in cell wall biosynthesis|nr:glycosyltransferase [Puniceicoccales bacterium]
MAQLRLKISFAVSALVIVSVAIFCCRLRFFPSNPKVSICIPVYNCEKYIAAALDSAIGQTLKNIEIVCVDDGSTDGTAAILNSYAARDRRIRLFSNGTNRGTLYSRLRAILESRGKYITWVDADDELYGDIAKLAYGRAVKSGADIVIFNADVYSRNGSKNRAVERFVNLRLGDINGPRSVVELIDLFRREKRLWLTCWCKLYRTSNLRKMALDLLPYATANRISFFDDNIFIWYALKNSNTYAALDKVGYRYIAMDGIGVNVNNRERVDGIIAVQRKILSDEKTNDAVASAMEYTSRHDQMAINIICSLPRPDGFAVFDDYLDSMPQQFATKVMDAVAKKDRKFLDAYVNYKTRGETGGDN